MFGRRNKNRVAPNPWVEHIETELDYAITDRLEDPGLDRAVAMMHDHEEVQLILENRAEATTFPA